MDTSARFLEPASSASRFLTGKIAHPAILAFLLPPGKTLSQVYYRWLISSARSYSFVAWLSRSNIQRARSQNQFILWGRARPFHSGPEKDIYMTGKTVVGIFLIVVGFVALVYQGFTYTTQKKVLDLGPIQATTEEHHTVPLPPILGVLALVGGVVVLASGRRG